MKLNKLFMVMFVMVLLVGTVSAFGFDNRLIYSDNDLKVEIKNSFGLGKVLGTIELKSHKSVNEILQFGYGKEEVVMFYDFKKWELYKNGLGEVTFKDMNTGKEIEKDYFFVEWKEVEVPNYIDVYNYEIIKNGTSMEVHDVIQDGTKLKYKWIKLENNDIPQRDVRIGLKTYVGKDDYHDAIWKIAGKKVKKHATWTSSLDVGLFQYWSFDQNSGTTANNNVTGGTAGTLTSDDPTWIAGKIGNGLDFTGATGKYMDMTGISSSTNSYAFSFWIKNGGGRPNGVHILDVQTGRIEIKIATGELLNLGGATPSTNYDTMPDNWDTFIVINYDSDNSVAKVYFNGTQVGTEPAYTNKNLGGSIVLSERHSKDSGGTNAAYDEMGIWNRTLSEAEISYLYNDGAGCAFGDGFCGITNPTVTLHAPVNNTNFTSGIGIVMNGTLFDDTNISIATLYLNDVGNETNSTAGINNSVYTFTKNMGAGDTFWTIEGCDFDNNCINASQIMFNVNTTPNIQYGAGVPVNEFNSTDNFFEVNVTITEDLFKNITFDLYKNGALNRSVTFTNSSRAKNWTNLIDSTYSYNVTVATTTSLFNSTGTRNISIDGINPELNVFFPTGTISFQEINTPLFVNWSVNDSNIDACVLQFQGVNTTQTCINNQTTIDINNSVNRSLIFYTNDTFGNINVTSVSWNYNIFQNVQNFNTTSFETELNNFTINITYNSTEFTDIKTNLYYNSTKHPTTQTGSGNDINFSTTLSRLFNPPRIKPFFWNFRITNTTGIFDINSTEKNQVEQPILFGACNATLTTPYVNFTFKDEGNLSIINASVPTSTFVYSLGNLTINKTLTFVDNTELENFDFCLNPPNRTLHTDFSLQYEKGGYQQRITELTQTLNSTLTTDVLYLLSNADGLFVTFQVINTAEQTISGAIVNASRIIDSVSTIVGTGITSDAGTKTFWLNPNFVHTVMAFKTGFSQYTTTNLFPDQSSFTINLGGEEVIGEEDYSKGVTFDIVPKGSLLNPNDNLVFNYTLTSSFWTVEEFSFGLRDDSGNVYANVTASTNGGTLTTTLNTTDNTTLIMDYNWVIDGNFSNSTTSWIIYNDTLDNDWGILTFANHLVLYMDDGLFGLDDFGLALITFLTIFLFTGVMSARFGLASPAAVTTLMFTLVLFFDVGLGLMDNLNPIGAVPNFPTMIVGLILIGVLIKDGVK